MKLSALVMGDRFMLNRTGETYMLGGPYFWQGKPTSRFVVIPDNPGEFDTLETIHSLSHQCVVTKLDAHERGE